MNRAEFKTVSEYIASRPSHARAALKRVRSIIRKTVPGAEESISYQMPAYKLHGRPLVYFAGWEEHYALYPASGQTVATIRAELAPYNVSKGTIRFEYSEPVPVKLIERIAKLRAKEVAARK